MKSFDPRILVFACNWCSYAGADTAGVSRIPQSPHFRLLRVMCSGRIHPAFVLRAFANGADGVMVSGCHFGDCHYVFGNHRAAEQFEKTKNLCALLGLEPRRLRLEWISAAEGPRFAATMNEFVEQVRALGPSPIAPAARARDSRAPAKDSDLRRALLSGARLYQCLECGRCSGICPVARHQTFSPRRLVSRALSSEVTALTKDPSVWSCLTCRRCQSICPTRVDVDRFMLSAREIATASWADDAGADDGPEPAAPPGTEMRSTCAHGGVFSQIARIMTRPGLRQRRLDWVTGDLRAQKIASRATERNRPPLAPQTVAPGERELFFAGCSPYFSAYFGGETGAGLVRALQASVRLLQRVGITPAVLENERCCGYHLRLSGRAAEADALEARVADQIARAGARRVITHCPECLIGLRESFARRNVRIEVVHLSQVLWNERDGLRTERAPTESGRVTYQDPCRLGRYARLFDAPREVFAALTGGQMTEMERNREHATCCGNTAWLNCNAGVKALQTERLAEAAATGADRLLTACPGCYIHLRCAQEGSAQDAAGRIAIEDLWSHLAAGSESVENVRREFSDEQERKRER